METEINWGMLGIGSVLAFIVTFLAIQLWRNRPRKGRWREISSTHPGLEYPDDIEHILNRVAETGKVTIANKRDDGTWEIKEMETEDE